MFHDFIVFLLMNYYGYGSSPHRHREPRASAGDRAVIKNAHGLSIPCASEVHLSGEFRNRCLLIKSTRECSGVDLQQRDDVFTFNPFANDADGVCIRTIRKICDVQQNRFETIQ